MANTLDGDAPVRHLTLPHRARQCTIVTVLFCPDIQCAYGCLCREWILKRVCPLNQQANSWVIGKTCNNQFQPPGKLYFSSISVNNVKTQYELHWGESPKTFQTGQQMRRFHHGFHV